MINLAVLGSTQGTNLTAVVEAINCNYLIASIKLVISNNIKAPILQKATNFGIQAIFADPQGASRNDYDQTLSTILREHCIDLVLLIGYMRILSPQFVFAWENKVINIHPSLLPAYSGLMNLEVHQAVLNAGETQTGCTVHFVTDEVDAGPIILQKHCLVHKNDNAETLKARVQQLEGVALVDAIKKIIEEGSP